MLMYIIYYAKLHFIMDHKLFNIISEYQQKFVLFCATKLIKFCWGANPRLWCVPLMPYVWGLVRQEATGSAMTTPIITSGHVLPFSSNYCNSIQRVMSKLKEIEIDELEISQTIKNWYFQHPAQSTPQP